MNTRGAAMSTCSAVWINFATQPRLAHWGCHDNSSSGRLEQSAQSLTTASGNHSPRSDSGPVKSTKPPATSDTTEAVGPGETCGLDSGPTHSYDDCVCVCSPRAASSLDQDLQDLN